VEPTAIPASARRRRRRWIWAFSGLVAAVLIVLAMLAAVLPLSSDALKHRVVATLSDRLNADVSLGDLHMRAFPRMHVEGQDLTIRQHGRGDVPPLIAIKRFEVHADLLGLFRKRVSHLQLEGLAINITPKPGEGNREDAEPKRPGRAVPPAGQNDQVRITTSSPDDHGIQEGMVVDSMDSVDAKLSIFSRDKAKEPKVWDIHQLHMTNLGVTKAMPYEATLTNGIPKGEIYTKGHFGPWHRDEPGDTPLDGTYTFDNADLSIFKGISGMLSSKGSFGGSLARIDANGETETPDFTIKVGGHPFPLHTKYHTIIDGTNGNTLLEQIDATFLQSSMVAKGGVIDTPGKKGRAVTLDVNMDRARIEDIMKMAVKTQKPPMTGGLKLLTKFYLPPGDVDVSEKLQLDGRFALTSARFTNMDVQGKIEELSKRGRGQKADAPKDRVASNFEGRFKLGGGMLRLPSFQFDVPGATVKLAGNYGLKSELIDFKGELLLDAKISETVSGFKSVLLKVVDPLFKQKDGSGSSLPIKIEGSRQEPKFGLDVRRVFKKGD
jgi:hypothetical protein